MDEKLLFFHEPGCPDCEVVMREILPRYLDAIGLGWQDVHLLDVGRPDVVKSLLDLEKRLGFRAKDLAPVVVFRERAYSGIDAIRELMENRE